MHALLEAVSEKAYEIKTAKSEKRRNDPNKKKDNHVSLNRPVRKRKRDSCKC